MVAQRGGIVGEGEEEVRKGHAYLGEMQYGTFSCFHVGTCLDGFLLVSSRLLSFFFCFVIPTVSYNTYVLPTVYRIII